MATTYGRTRDDSLPQEFDTQYVFQNGIPAGTYGPYVTNEELAVIKDTVTPGYRRLIANGAIINNACDMYRSSYVCRGGSYYASQKTNPANVYTHEGAVIRGHLQFASSWSDPLTIDIADLLAGAAQTAVASVNSTPYGFAEDLGELRETIRFLKNPGKSLLDLTRKMQKKSYKYTKKLKKARQIAEAVNDTYLGYRFALTPLIKSASDATLAYEQTMQKKRLERENARGIRIETDSLSDQFDINFGGGVYDTFSRRRSTTVTCRCHILYSHSGAMDRQHQLGIRGIDIPETAWNLVPLSFMVDRAYNISDTIRGATNLFDPRLKMLAASKVYKIDQSVEVSFDSQTHPSFNVTTDGTASYTKFVYVRDPWKPSLADTVPVFTPGRLVDDALAVADLFSLTGSILNGLAYKLQK